LHNQSYSKKVANWIAEEGLVEDVIRMDFIPHQDVPKFAASLDVGTIPFNVRNPTAYYSAPIKMWEYFSQMKPVVATPIPEALRNSDSVLIASEAVDYVRHFSAILSRGDEMCGRVKRGYEKARHHTWSAAADKFAQVCERVLGITHASSR
jgi:hypothetical protein